MIVISHHRDHEQAHTCFFAGKSEIGDLGAERRRAGADRTRVLVARRNIAAFGINFSVEPSSNTAQPKF